MLYMDMMVFVKDIFIRCKQFKWIEIPNDKPNEYTDEWEEFFMGSQNLDSIFKWLNFEMKWQKKIQELWVRCCFSCISSFIVYINPISEKSFNFDSIFVLMFRKPFSMSFKESIWRNILENLIIFLWIGKNLLNETVQILK